VGEFEVAIGGASGVDREQDIELKCGALDGLRRIDAEIAALYNLPA
jgi:hypothetical protein